MITEGFDRATPAIISPVPQENRPQADVCIITFSGMIEQYARERYGGVPIASLKCATGDTPVYLIERKGKRIAFYQTYVGAPITVGLAEDAAAALDCRSFILFGGAGCLNKEIAHGKVMIPTAAFRDEGTSYHYAPAADYIEVKKAPFVAECMEKNGIPFVLGKTWTTDAIYRETRGNFAKRKAEGCISVEMECAGLQAMCDFRGLSLYAFFTSGDLLDAPEWDARRTEGDLSGTQHDVGHFDVALALAEYVAGKERRAEPTGLEIR